MKLLRRNLLAMIPASILAVFGNAAQAAVGPTLKPTKLGQKIVFRGYTYICIKSNGKLIWKKGAKVVAGTASAKPSATPTTTASQTQGVLTFVAKSSDIAEGDLKIIDVKPLNKFSFPVSVTRVKGVVIVISAICTHQGCQIEVLSGGLACPCHGSAFNALTGAVVRGPANSGLKKYTASEDGGSINILA